MGLDERSGFRPVPLANPRALKQGLAGRARGFEPPVVVDMGKFGDRMGLYPQQFFPRFVIQATSEPLQGAPYP